MKDKAQTGRKIFAEHISDKRLLSKIYKKFLKVNKKITQLKKGGTKTEQTPQQRRHTDDK